MSQPTTEFPIDNPGIATLTQSERHRLLSAERRRMALTILEERSTPMVLADLATEIAVQDDGLDGTD